MKKMNDFILEEEVRELDVTAKLTKEEKAEIIKASDDKRIVKYLVDQYIQSQDYRIVAENQARALKQGFDEADKIQWNFIEKEIDNAKVQESLNKKYMDIVTNQISICRWMKSIMGIGPCFSAYLYAAFDVKVGTYNTNFLSYAGLNDNNNPWLGKEKAAKLTSEAVLYRDEKYLKMTNTLENNCDPKKLKKLTSAFKKLVSTEYDVDDVIKTINDITGFNIRGNDDFDTALICDWAKWTVYPKICDDILIQYASNATGRNIVNIKNGVKRNWENKKQKTTYITIDDLSSYLAKPPYNKDLKSTAFLIGESFAKVCNKEKSLYGKIYKNKKLEYTQKNDNGEYAEQAAEELERKNYGKDTDAYKALIKGKLPKKQIDMRAKRYATKLFISHVYEAMYYAEFHEEAPKTYVIQYLGHHDYIAPEVDYRPYIDGEL